MAKKKIGYIELQWECPNCGTLNPGSSKVCEGCGAPQPEDVEFIQTSKQELITDEKKLEKAKAGADLHCAYCGTRNPAGAESCSQCKASLSEGHQRKAGQVIGAFQEGPVQTINCPHCGEENLETARSCTQCGGLLAQESVPPPASQRQPAGGRLPKASRQPNKSIFIIVGLVLLAACVAIYFVFLRTTAVTGIVTDVEWERSVIVEQIIPVKYQDWYDQIPTKAEIISCVSEVRDQVDSPVAGSEEICGTPYTVDQGSGYAEVVQDCIYIVYDDFCAYSVLEWSAVDSISVTGYDFAAFWPEPALAEDERLAEGEEYYQITFSSGSEYIVYLTTDFDLFQQAQIGTEWELEINSLGDVQSINP